MHSLDAYHWPMGLSEQLPADMDGVLSPAPLSRSDGNGSQYFISIYLRDPVSIIFSVTGIPVDYVLHGNIARREQRTTRADSGD